MLKGRFFNVKVTDPRGYIATYFVTADDPADAASELRRHIGEGEEKIEVGSLLSNAEIEYLGLIPGEVRQYLGALVVQGDAGIAKSESMTFVPPRGKRNQG